MSKILVIRFSALGDVAMTVPVLFSFARQYPQHQLVVLSRKQMGVLFKEAPQNITFRGVDLKKDYKGIKGLAQLYSELKEEKFDAIADLHDVLRSKFLRWRFLLSGTKVAHIDKGRKGKRKLTSLNHKVKTQQATSFKRYTDVLQRLGFPFKPEFKSIYPDAGEISRSDTLLVGRLCMQGIPLWRRRTRERDTQRMGEEVPQRYISSRKAEDGRRTGIDEPARRNGIYGLWQHALGVFGRYSCSFNMGSHSPVRWLHGMGTI